ncbi:ribosome biogenesis protein tsr3 [Anaeramoeba flamelloides]|uniref:18S rRNA aminocarboxypropyltransferase n=1 Tax=Anaeramoeba flamelloides TaxID=1746091 RepID=A0ABQ8Z1W9_9EUKA|nr:ribosome biogenesis protein tsr3 [Anaeramoeba flamelloides]
MSLRKSGKAKMKRFEGENSRYSKKKGKGRGRGRGRGRGKGRGKGRGRGKRKIKTRESYKKRKFPIQLAMYYFNQCDTKRCTGCKLEKHGFVRALRLGERFNGILLSAWGTKTVTASDRELISKNGLAVVDCSWNKIDQIPKKSLHGQHRILPFLVAGNSTHYGQPAKLSCSEALSAALWIAGFPEEATEIMQIFIWGNGFINLNREVLDLYKECYTHEEVIQAQNLFLENARNEKKKNQSQENDSTSSDLQSISESDSFSSSSTSSGSESENNNNNSENNNEKEQDQEITKEKEKEKEKEN